MERVTRGSLSVVGLGGALGISALAAGGIHLSILAPCALLLVGAGLLAARYPPVDQRAKLFGSFPSPPTWREFAPALVFWGLGCVCWLQTMPLPLDWVRSISPENADIWTRSVRPWNTPPPALVPLSLAPGRTAVEALKMSCYGLVFAISFGWARAAGLLHVVRLIFGLCLIVATATLALSLGGATSLYGVYSPLNAASIAPILNDNSLSGYINIGIFCGVGLLFHGRSRKSQPLLLLGLVVMVGTVLTRQSRAAGALLLLGLVALLLKPARASNSETQRGMRSPGVWLGTVAGVVTAGGGLAYLATRRTGWDKFVDASVDKFDLLRSSGQWALEQRGLGIGRGAFGSAYFPRTPLGTSNSSFDHAENVMLQWGVEWGLGITAVALLILGWSLRPLISKRSLAHPLRRGLFTGLAVLLIQNTVDLGLEIPAVASLFACGLGGLCGARGRNQSPPASGPPRSWLVAGCGLTALSLGLAAFVASPLLTQERSRIRALFPSPGSSSAEFLQELKHASRSFPADPYFPLLGSAVEGQSNQQKLSWIALALERGPRQAVHYIQLAKILHQGGARAQALGALRQALELDPREGKSVLKLNQSWSLSPDEARQTIPEGRAGANLLRELALELNDRNLRLQWLQESLERDPRSAKNELALARELVAQLSIGSASQACHTNRAECEARALHHLEQVQLPGDPAIEILSAKLQVAQGNPVLAERSLAKSCKRFPGDPRCPASLVPLALANGSDRLPEAIDQWLSAGCSLPAHCAATHTELGRLLVHFNRENEALSHFQLAAQEVPSRNAWLQVARLAKRLHLQGAVERARRRAQHLSASPDSGRPPHAH